MKKKIFHFWLKLGIFLKSNVKNVKEEMKVKEDPTAVFVTKSLVLYIFREPKTFPSTVTVKLRIMITWIYKEFKSPKLKENWF